jgi:hypothetical protein
MVRMPKRSGRSTNGQHLKRSWRRELERVKELAETERARTL